MDAKSNAKQAMRELLGYVGVESESKNTAQTVVEEEPPATEHRRPLAVPTPTVIGTDAQIVGDIVSKAAIEVYGTITGNVTTTDSVKISGRVTGNVSGNGVLLLGCKIKGNVLSGTLLTMDSTSVVNGELQGENVSVDGRLRGNVNAGNLADLKAHALILGDINAARFSMSDGTRLVGNIRIACPNMGNDEDLEKEFEF